MVTLSIGATLDPQGSKPVETKAKVIFLDQTERNAVVEVGNGIKVVFTENDGRFTISSISRLSV